MRTERMMIPVVVVLAAATARSQPYELLVSMGTRETGSTAPIGQPGGIYNNIEWVNLDGQSLVLDGTWQCFSFDMRADPITAFVGNDVLDGDAGTLENIRLKSTGFAGPITIWIDDVADNTQTQGMTVFGDFEGYSPGDRVMFQRPTYSGSTYMNVLEEPNIAQIDHKVSHSGDASYRVEFQFVDSDPSRWLRLTTTGYPGSVLPQGDPTIRYDDLSVVSFWMKAWTKGIPEPSTSSLLVLGILVLSRLRPRPGVF